MAMVFCKWILIEFVISTSFCVCIIIIGISSGKMVRVAKSMSGFYISLPDTKSNLIDRNHELYIFEEVEKAHIPTYYTCPLRMEWRAEHRLRKTCSTTVRVRFSGSVHQNSMGKIVFKLLLSSWRDYGASRLCFSSMIVRPNTAISVLSFQ